MTCEYRPDHLLDMLMEKADLSTDAELAKKLQVKRAMISHIRHKRLKIGAGLLLRMHDVFGHSIQTLREWAGIEGWRKA
jgi:plasmid maintenance system antidote protein VapI